MIAFCTIQRAWCLSTETVESASLALQGEDNVHGCDSLSASVLGVSDGVADDVLEEDLEDTSSLFVDGTRDTLDTSSSGESADGRLGDTLDVIAKYLSVALGSGLAESLSSLSSSVSRHVVELLNG